MVADVVADGTGLIAGSGVTDATGSAVSAGAGVIVSVIKGVGVVVSTGDIVFVAVNVKVGLGVSVDIPSGVAESTEDGIISVSDSIPDSAVCTNGCESTKFKASSTGVPVLNPSVESSSRSDAFARIPPARGFITITPMPS